MSRIRTGGRVAGALGAALIVGTTISPLAGAVRPMSPGRAGAVTARRAPVPVPFEASSQAEADAVSQVLAARERRSALEGRVRELDATAARLGDRARAAAADVARLDAAQLISAVEVRRVAGEFRRAQARTRATAAEVYRESGRSAPPVIGLLGGSASVRDAGLVGQYLERTGDRVSRDLRAVRRAKRAVAAANAALRARRLAVEQAAVAARADEAAVLALRADQDRALAAARAEEARENALLVSVRAQRAAFERAAAQAQAVSGTIEEILRARPRTGTAPTNFLFPADGPITSGFGSRRHPIFQTVRMHSGIDIGAGYGASVRAGAAGVVVVAGDASGYGNTVVIDHGGGVATLYAHLSKLGVRVGQTVTGGQTVGAVGSSGNSTGPHLHFEVRVQGVPVDPTPYL